LLADEPPWDGMFVAVEGDAEHLGDAMALDIVGVERRIRKRLEETSFLMLEDEDGHLSGVLMNAPVGEVIAPRGCLGVEIEQIAKASPGPEASSGEADRSLDASLLVALSDVAGAHGEAAAGAGIFEEFGIEHGGGGRVREHDGLHVVEDVDGGGAPEEVEAPVHASQERAHRLTDRELDVEMTRVAEDGDERADTPGDAGQRESEVGPVHLHRLARREVERQERLAMLARAETPETVAQDRDAAGVPERPEPLEYRGSQHLGRIVEDGSNGRLVRVEDRTGRLGGRVWRVCSAVRGSCGRSFAPCRDAWRSRAPRRPRRDRDGVLRRRARRDRAASFRTDQAKPWASVAEVADSAEQATRSRRGDREVEVNERTFGGPQLVAPGFAAEPIVAVAARRNHSVKRLAAPEGDPLEQGQESPRVARLSRQTRLDQVVALGARDQ